MGNAAEAGSRSTASLAESATPVSPDGLLAAAASTPAALPCLQAHLRHFVVAGGKERRGDSWQALVDDDVAGMGEGGIQPLCEAVDKRAALIASLQVGVHKSSIVSSRFRAVSL